MLELLVFFLNTFVAIFVIVDPFALMPVYLSLTERFTESQKRRIVNKSVIISAVILLIIAFTGLAVFKMFGITMPAFQIAGGILLLFMGFDQLNGDLTKVKADEQDETFERDDISIFPISTPLIAGPGSISTVVLHTTKVENSIQYGVVVLAILMVILCCYVLLRAAPILTKLMGKTGINLLTRIMGIILCALSIQFIINGLEAVLIQFKIISG